MAPYWITSDYCLLYFIVPGNIPTMDRVGKSRVIEGEPDFSVGIGMGGRGQLCPVQQYYIS